MTQRMDEKFVEVQKQRKAALVTYIMAGDPNTKVSTKILNKLPKAGADIIELGMPFSDPMADGPAIQAAALRALKAKHKMKDTLNMVREFRKNDNKTPIVLMGYYNPIYQYGNDKFLNDASKAGVDGLIIVDLPPEMDDELCIPAKKKNIDFIRLATPTTDKKRLPKVLSNISGFLYYVSMTGITGAKLPDLKPIEKSVAKIKKMTSLPVCVGFGIKTPEHAKNIAKIADGVVVGSALVSIIGKRQKPVDEVINKVRKIADGIRKVKK